MFTLLCSNIYILKLSRRPLMLYVSFGHILFNFCVKTLLTFLYLFSVFLFNFFLNAFVCFVFIYPCLCKKKKYSDFFIFNQKTYIQPFFLGFMCFCFFQTPHCKGSSLFILDPSGGSSMTC